MPSYAANRGTIHGHYEIPSKFKKYATKCGEIAVSVRSHPWGLFLEHTMFSRTVMTTVVRIALAVFLFLLLGTSTQGYCDDDTLRSTYNG